jgi:hypothetical protein
MIAVSYTETVFLVSQVHVDVCLTDGVIPHSKLIYKFDKSAICPKYLWQLCYNK